MLLAAGLGTRLMPITANTPKCLVVIKGRPLLGIWLESLRASGIGPYLINTHYLAEQVSTFVKTSAFNDSVMLTNELHLLGTAGTLQKNIDFFGEDDGMLIHADNYCLADLAAFVSAHHKRPEHCVMTMMTFRTDSPSASGIVEIDQHGVVTKFYEKISNPPGNLANGALYILSRELIQQFKTQSVALSDFSTEVIPELIGKIYTYETDMPFLDIGTVENYNKVK